MSDMSHLQTLAASGAIGQGMQQQTGTQGWASGPMLNLSGLSMQNIALVNDNKRPTMLPTLRGGLIARIFSEVAAVGNLPADFAKIGQEGHTALSRAFSEANVEWSKLSAAAGQMLQGTGTVLTGSMNIGSGLSSGVSGTVNSILGR